METRLPQTLAGFSQTHWDRPPSRFLAPIPSPLPNGLQAHYSVNYATYSVKTNFGCNGVGDYPATNVSLISSINLPDGTSYSFTYEPTPGFPGSYTGRVRQITLPTGGTITYSYTGSNNGIICADGSAVGLNRTVSPGGQWTYSRTNIAGSHWQTKITMPTGDDTVMDFQKDVAANSYNFYETQMKTYQGSSTSGTLLTSGIRCYNTVSPVAANCPTTAVSSPIGRRTSFTYLPDTSASSVQSETDTQYYNNTEMPTEVDSYDFGSGAVGTIIRKVITTYGTFGSTIKPTNVTVEDASNAVRASTTYSYDQTAVSATTGTPNLSSVSGGRGNVTTIATQISGSNSLYRKLTYYDTGNVSTTTDVGTTSNGGSNITTYTYNNSGTPSPSCGNSFPTLVSKPLNLSQSFTWDCNGGTRTSVTDENANVSTVYYTGTNFGKSADPSYWRPYATTDQLNNPTTFSYPSGTVSERAMAFNGSNSVADRRIKLDGLGRPIVSQIGQTPSPSKYDSTENDYDSAGRLTKTTLPYSGVADALCSGSCPGSSATYDGAGRLATLTDSAGRNDSYTYPYNDIYQSIAAPSTENAKRKQLEYDSLGRLKSVCEITASTNQGTACSQSNVVTGYYTTYTYDVLDNRTGVTQKSSVATQSRSYSYDMLGRLTSETNPESGTTQNVYDAWDSSCGTYSSAGDLVEKKDAVGNVTCIQYDAMHRATQITYPSAGPYASRTRTKCFVYDTATVNSVAMGNAKSRLAEAYTTTAVSCPGTKKVDEGFSYSARGELTDAWESTPNSGGYYHPTAGYWANGAISSLWISSLPNITYGLDGEGRTSTVSSSSGQNPVTGTSYNASSQVTSVSFGSGAGDTDAFTFDPNSGRVTQYKYSVNGSSEIGNLTWNGNGSLKTLAITDPFNSGDAQTCNYAHDDLSRIASVNCGTVWSQTFSYDAFGNITKSGSISWQPGYSNLTNRYVLGGTSYDSNGNLLNDTFHAYTWDANAKPATIDLISLTYDAFDRMVEQNQSGTFYQVVYTPFGSKLGIFHGQTIQQLYLPLPGGAQAEYLSWGLSHYRHADWLGSNRLESNTTRSILDNNAYAPFGEPYAQTGNGEISFTGQNKDTAWLQYDFLVRQYDPKQGRWISPDPAGLVAVNPTKPQTWNRYAYAENNPLAYVDPDGTSDLGDAMAASMSSGLFGGSYGWGGTGCLIDGVGSSCSMASGLLAGNAANVCPNADCTGLTAEANGDLYRRTMNVDLTLDCNGSDMSSYSCVWSRWSQNFVQNGDSGDPSVGLDIWHCPGCSATWENANQVSNPRTIALWYGLSGLVGIAMVPGAFESVAEAFNTGLGSFEARFPGGLADVSQQLSPTPSIPATVPGTILFLGQQGYQWYQDGH